MPSAVNPQIISSLQTTREMVLGEHGFAADLVRSQVTQALGLAVADATDYMRNMAAICTAATGVAFRMILSGDAAKIPAATTAIEKANEVIANAAKNLATVGESVSGVLQKWPSSSS